MKKNILLVLCVLGLGLVSCDDFYDAHRTEDLLIGNWESVWSEGWHREGGVVNDWSNSIPGQIRCRYGNYGRGNDNLEGDFDWSLTGDVINIFYMRYPNDPVYLKILELTENSLVIEDAYSDAFVDHYEQITFRRVY